MFLYWFTPCQGGNNHANAPHPQPFHGTLLATTATIIPNYFPSHYNSFITSIIFFYYNSFSTIISFILFMQQSCHFPSNQAIINHSSLNSFQFHWKRSISIELQSIWHLLCTIATLEPIAFTAALQFQSRFNCILPSCNLFVAIAQEPRYNLMINQVFASKVDGALVVIIEVSRSHIAWVPAGGNSLPGGNLLIEWFDHCFVSASGPVLSRNTRSYRKLNS